MMMIIVIMMMNEREHELIKKNKDFIDHTSEDHDDYRQLLQALSDLKRIANSVNESMKVGDTVQRVIDIDTTLGGQELIAPHRRWVKDDEFTKLESPMGIYLKTPIHLYLFNDILVIAQKIISGFGFKYSAIRIELNNLFVYPYCLFPFFFTAPSLPHYYHHRHPHYNDNIIIGDWWMRWK